MKAIAFLIWICAVLMGLIGCSSMLHGAAASPVTPIPDLPEGWEKAGPGGLVVLVVLLFLTYLTMERKRQANNDAEQIARDAAIHREHAERLGALAHELSDKFCQSIVDQQEHCKAELTQLTGAYREQIDFLKTQNNTAFQRFLVLSGHSTAEESKATERMGS